jgi:hypothetical protein
LHLNLQIAERLHHIHHLATGAVRAAQVTSALSLVRLQRLQLLVLSIQLPAKIIVLSLQGKHLVVDLLHNRSFVL